MSRILLAILLLLPAMGSMGQVLEPDPDDYEPVLFPFPRVGFNGINGSVWRADHSMRNISDQEQTYTVLSVPVFGNGPQVRHLGPGEVEQPELLGLGPLLIEGAYIFVEKGHADAFDFSQRVWEEGPGETSRDPGLEVPVFTLADLGTHLSFLNLVAAPGHRIWLRVYDPLIAPGGMVRIVVRRLRRFPGTGEIVYEEIRPLLPGTYRTEPPGVEVLQTPSQLAVLLPLESEEERTRYVVDVESLTPGMKIGGFITVTDNETQIARIVTAQKSDE